jgi:hypothetical protein
MNKTEMFFNLRNTVISKQKSDTDKVTNESCNKKIQDSYIPTIPAQVLSSIPEIPKTERHLLRPFIIHLMLLSLDSDLVSILYSVPSS